MSPLLAPVRPFAPTAKAGVHPGYAPARTGASAESGPIQRNGDKEPKKPPPPKTSYRDYFRPPTHEVLTKDGRKVQVRPTYPSFYGLTTGLNMKASVDDAMGKGHGTASLNRSGDLLRNFSIKGQSGKGTSDAVHQGIAKYLSNQFDTVPKHISSTWANTDPSGLKKGNLAYSEQLLAAYKNAGNKHPDPETLARLQVSGYGGAPGLAGAKAKARLNYKPVEAQPYYWKGQHPNPRVNLQHLQKYFRHSGFRGLGLGLVGSGLLYNQLGKKEGS